MKITDCKLFYFSIPLKQKLYLKKQYIDKREGYIIRIESGDKYGLGEISPLPFFHKENLMEAKQQWDSFKKEICSKNLLDPKTFIKRWCKKFSPSVLWGIEMALWNLYANIQNKSVVSLWSQRFYDVVEINGLLNGNKESVTKQSHLLKQQNVTTVKLKIGRLSLEEDVENVLIIRNIFENNINIRLDANRSWNMEETLSFIAKIGLENIEYIEEPVSKEHILPLLESTNFPIALDESIYEDVLPENPICAKIAGVVIKPALLGGINKTFAWQKWCKNNNVTCTISSTFETGVGIAMLAFLAAINYELTPAGLDTHKWLKYDILNKTIVQQNSIEIAGLNYDQKNIHWNYLTPI